MKTFIFVPWTKAVIQWRQLRQPILPSSGKIGVIPNFNESLSSVEPKTRLVTTAMDVNVNQNGLVTNIRQNIFYAPQKEESQTHLERHESE